MMTALPGIAMVVTLMLGLTGWLWLAERAQARRDARHARQITLTDAIHRELGAVAAPFVTRRRGKWLVSMRVPLDRPAMVTAILSITEREFGPARGPGAGPYQITLIPAAREPRAATAGVSHAADGKPARLAA